MSDPFVIFGWTLEQWQKAFDYFKESGVNDLFAEALVSAGDNEGQRSDASREAFRKLLTIQRDWRMKRLDEPCEIKIQRV